MSSTRDLGWSITAALSLAAGMSSSAIAAEEESAGLQEVTVTATKTGETAAQSTALALTVYGADEMSQRAIGNINGIFADTPGLQLTDLSGYTQLFIRGVGSNTVYVGSDPSSTLSVDGVYQARPLSFTTDFLDVDRVEVLKGPQGTLYGRNAIGGAINVISRAPSSTLTGELQLSGGNYGEVGAQGYISGPLGDSGMLGSLALNRYTHDFYLDNVSTGGGVENADHYGTHGQLLIPFSSAASLTLRGNYAYSSDAFGGDPKLLVPIGVPLDDSILGDYRTVALNAPAYSTFKQFGLAADFVLHLSDTMTLKSLTAYQNFWGELGLDADSSSLNILYTIENPIRQHQISEELNLNATWDALTYVVGAYYFTENDAEPLTVLVPGANVANLNSGKIVDESEALYGQAEYHFTPKLSAIVGLRYTHESKDYSQWNSWVASADPAQVNNAPVIGPPYFPPAFVVMPSRSWSATTPKFGVNYTPTDNILTYVSATRGFKSGGFDFGSPTAQDATNGYNPEYLWAYELGVKSEWFQHRLRVNLDGFFYQYSDMQVEVFVPPANAITENAATSHISGVDLEVAARPIAPLELHTTLAYLHARYENFPGAYVNPFGNFNASGNALNQAPDWAYTGGATYTFGLGHLGSAYAGVDYTGQSRVYFTPANNGVGGVTGYPQQQGDYGLLSARAGWNSPDSRWNFVVIGLNLTQRQYVTGTVNYGAGVAGRPGDPRTVRGQVTYKF